MHRLFTLFYVFIGPVTLMNTSEHWAKVCAGFWLAVCLLCPNDYTTLHALWQRKGLWVGYQRPCPALRTLTVFTPELRDLCHSLVLEQEASLRHDGSEVSPPGSPGAQADPVLRRGGLRCPADVLHVRLPDTGSLAHVNCEAPQAQAASRLTVF